MTHSSKYTSSLITNNLFVIEIYWWNTLQSNIDLHEFIYIFKTCCKQYVLDNYLILIISGNKCVFLISVALDDSLSQWCKGVGSCYHYDKFINELIIVSLLYVHVYYR